MAGLLSSQRGAPTDANGQVPRNAMANPPPEDEMGMGDMEGEQPNVSPEEQKAYDAFVDNGLRLIFDKRTAPGLLDRIKKGKTPVEGLASATVYVVDAVRKSAEKAGQQVPDEVVFHAGFELVSNVATLSAAARVHEFSEDEIEQAIYIGLDLYATMEMQEGRLDAESALNDFETVVAADKAGRIDDVIPGATQAAERARQKMAAMDQKQRRA